jgi:hypothetical protein
MRQRACVTHVFATVSRVADVGVLIELLIELLV